MSLGRAAGAPAVCKQYFRDKDVAPRGTVALPPVHRPRVERIQSEDAREGVSGGRVHLT